MTHRHTPTSHATTIGDFNPIRTTPVGPPRTVAYCPCGARLSQYRPPMTSRCWACENRGQPMTRTIAEIDGFLEEARVAIERIATQRAAEDHVWAAITLATTVSSCRSVLASKPVLVDNLNPGQLHHALRGSPPPPLGSYITVTPAMLTAICEAGPTPETWADIPERLRPTRKADKNEPGIATQPPRIAPPRTWIPR